MTSEEAGDGLKVITHVMKEEEDVTLSGAPYFSYYEPRMKCQCKSTDAGRIAKDGIVSGETSCDDTLDPPTTPPAELKSEL